MKRISAIGLACVIGASTVVGGAVTATAEDYLRDAKHDNKVAIRGCVVRFDKKDASGEKTVPTIHANESHYCVGVTDVDVEADGDLVVRSDTVGPIMSLAVSSDETLTEKGITCGGSGGGGTTIVRCFDRDGTKVRADGREIHGARSNLWLSWFTWQDE